MSMEELGIMTRHFSMKGVLKLNKHFPVHKPVKRMAYIHKTRIHNKVVKGQPIKFENKKQKQA